MLLENVFPSPIVIRGNYDASTQYNVGDVVRFVSSGVSKGWLLLVTAPVGTAPRSNSAYWVEFTAALAESVGAQGLPAPSPMVEYSATDAPDYTWRNTYADGDNFRRISYDGGTVWTIERIRGEKGEKGDTPVVQDGEDGENAPLVIWQYAADPPDDVTPLEWRDNYVQGDVWKHWSNDGGTTWGPPERILGRDGRDGFDLERQYSISHDGPWEARDTGQEWVRDRIGNVDPFGVPYRRSGNAHPDSGVTESRVRQLATAIADAAAIARYTDPEKEKLGGVEPNATADQSPQEIRDALASVGISFDREIIDMLDGLRDATVADYGKLGIGPDGILYRVKRTANPGHDASGMFNEYMHAQYRGVAHGRPSNPQAGEIYYNIRIHQWYLFFENRVVVSIDAQPITPIQALGANTEWIGEVDDNYQAIHAIQNFDNTKVYYAVYGETLYVLDNTTYSAATTETTYTYKWIPVADDTPEPIADEDKVDKAALDPIVTVYPNEKRKSDLLDIYTVQVYNLAAVLPNVDQVRITFADEQVTNTGSNVTRQEFTFAINEALAAKIEAATPLGRGHWLVQIEFYENGEVKHSVGVPVHFILTPPDSIAIEQNTRDIETLEDKTADMFVHATPGDWEFLRDANIGSIGSYIHNTANQEAIRNGTFDFETITWQNYTVNIPESATLQHEIVVRTVKSLGRVETRFRVYERDVGDEVDFPLRQLIGQDDTYYYYSTVEAGAGENWIVQYRGTHPHNTFNGMLGETPLSQINAQLPDKSGSGTTPGPTPSVGSGVLAYEAIPNATTISVRQIVTYQNGYYGSLTTHTKEGGDNPASDTARWRYLSSVIGNWVAGNYPAGTIAKAGGEQWIANESIVADDPVPTNENNTKWKRLTSHEGLTALITRVEDAFGEISDNRDRLTADETKLENFINTVNEYFQGHGEGDVTADQIALLFSLLDEYNPVVDEIRSTLGLVTETFPPERMIQGYSDQTTFLSNAAVPATLPKIEYKINYLNQGRQDAVLASSGEDTTARYKNLRGIKIIVGGSSGDLSIVQDPFLRYYLNGDTDEADAIQRCAFFIADNRLYILLGQHSGGGADPLAAFTSATLRPYISYAPLDDLAVDGTITKQAVETLAPTNADHDVPFIPSFQTEEPAREITLQTQDARGWYFNNFDPDTPITFNKILAKWYSDFQWISRMYEEYSTIVQKVDRGLSPSDTDPRTNNWIDGSKDPQDAGASVIRPPYPSLDALKRAFPIPDLTFYFKLSVDGIVMNLADHELRNPKRNKLVQIPDTHYNTPPRVAYLPTVARENELFQLVSNQYRPDSDHTWTHRPEKTEVGGRSVVGLSISDIGGHKGVLGLQEDGSAGGLSGIFQASAVYAFVAYSDDPEHFHLFINNQRVATTDTLVVDLHGERSDGSPIVRTASFSYVGPFSEYLHFSARSSGAYNVIDFSQKLSLSIKRGNTYLYLNPDNNPPSPEWDTGLLFTAGLYKGKADGTFAKSVILEETTLNLIVNRFGGRELLEKTGSYPYRVIANANASLTDAIATNDTRFSDTGLFLNQANDADDKHLSQFDRLLFEVYLLNGSNVAVASTSFAMSLTQLSAIAAQGTANVSATNQVDATVEDGRAVIHNWRTKDKPIAPVDVGGGGKTAKDLANEIETNIRNWINSFRSVDHTIYIGRTGETNSRLLIAVKSHKLSIGLQVRGYH